MWPFKKKEIQKWASPRIYTILLAGRPPMLLNTTEDLIAKHRLAVEEYDPLITLLDEGSNEPGSQLKTEDVQLVILGGMQQGEKNGGPKQLQP
jgi:hypothetical protein